MSSEWSAGWKSPVCFGTWEFGIAKRYSLPCHPPSPDVTSTPKRTWPCVRAGMRASTEWWIICVRLNPRVSLIASRSGRRARRPAWTRLSRSALTPTQSYLQLPATRFVVRCVHCKVERLSEAPEEKNIKKTLIRCCSVFPVMVKCRVIAERGDGACRLIKSL